MKTETINCFAGLALLISSVSVQMEAADVAVPQVAAGDAHTVGLKTDGTAVAVGYNGSGQCDVGSWTDLVQVSAGYDYTVALKADGTAVAVGYSSWGALDVDSWTDLVEVSAGDYHTVGLKADGTAVAVGYNYDGRCDVGSWTDLVQISAAPHHTVGLKADGTAVALGYSAYGRCDVGSWTDLVQVSSGFLHTVGLKADGTAVAVGYTTDGQCDVGSWTDLIQVSAGDYHTVGLKADGTAEAVGYNTDGRCDVGSWTDLVQVSAGVVHTVGLKADGTVVAVGYNYDGRCDVETWSLSSNIPPFAVAGNDQNIRAGDTVVLNGGESYDDNTPSENLVYSWSFALLPTGSEATLIDPDTSYPSFVADVADTYVVQLIVEDEGSLISEPDMVIISTDNLAPTAHAIVDPPLVVTGNPVQFDASGSVDPEDDPLTFEWTLSAAPVTSIAVPSGADTMTAGLTPDLPGVYEVILVVSDSLGPGDPLTVGTTAADPEEYAEIVVVVAAAVVADLPPAEVTTKGNQNALGNFLSQVLSAIDSGHINVAIDKLEKAIERTDGCILRGEPDTNGPWARDWITDCESQVEAYEVLMAALEALTST